MSFRFRAITMGLISAGLCAAWSCSGSDDPVIPDEDRWPAPTLVNINAPGYPPVPQPTDNRATVEGVALGRMLFYDPILSGDSTQSCASCHQFGRAFSDTLQFSLGIRNMPGGRNATAITNPAWLPNAFWDGRAASLEEQATMPVENPVEMDAKWDDVVVALQATTDYPELYGKAFGTDIITKDLTVKAIAQFERTFVSYRSKYDAWLATGDPVAAGFTPAQTRGRQIFDSEVGDCFHCHNVNVFMTDFSFRNVGLDSPLVDLGLGDRTGNPNDMGKFRVPTLRNIELTAPYMHDGRFATLEDVVNHYNSGGNGTATVDPLIRVGVGLGMTPQEVSDLVEFLKTMTDTEFANDPVFSNPHP